jgi:hypothetical protein
VIVAWEAKVTPDDGASHLINLPTWSQEVAARPRIATQGAVPLSLRLSLRRWQRTAGPSASLSLSLRLKLPVTTVSTHWQAELLVVLLLHVPYSVPQALSLKMNFFKLKNFIELQLEDSLGNH